MTSSRASETVAVTGTAPDDSDLTVDAASVTITDDDTATVSVAAASAAEGGAVDLHPQPVGAPRPPT